MNSVLVQLIQKEDGSWETYSNNRANEADEMISILNEEIISYEKCRMGSQELIKQYVNSNDFYHAKIEMANLEGIMKGLDSLYNVKSNINTMRGKI